MSEMNLIPLERFGREFIPAQYLPAGCDEYYLRNQQVGKPSDYWRSLRADEIETLVKNNNTCDCWDDLLVADPFNPRLVKNSEFYGLVRIGRLERIVLEYHDFQMPVGISDSVIIACDIGDNCVLNNVRYLAHYILGDNVMLLNVEEMHTTDHAKFGNGIVKDGEEEPVRVWLDLVNEMSGRAVMPFDGMTSADAYLWSKYRQDAELQARFRQITQDQFDSRRGFYGTVGDACVIKNCGIIKDVKIGACSYIKGANKLKNLTINSSAEEATQIGEGVELVNGIIGLGCHIFYGCKAVRFVLCDNSHLKYGARLIHSVLGSNSTVSCCEILYNLVFPAHEQHHNNSFLCAALVKGQSNIAAGATIGSNHNSRANDGEIEAGRGFWPGLCVTLKHSSRFASFALVSKGDYPAELNIPLPFSLVSNDQTHDRLEVMPAFWWLFNMYALVRNSWKLQERDIRITKAQHVEFDFLAPDTAEEMFTAMRLLEIWTAKARLHADQHDSGERSDDDLARFGRELLSGEPGQTATIEVLGDGLEKGRRKVFIIKPRAGYQAYREMLLYYAVKNLLAYLVDHPQATLRSMMEDLAGSRHREWVNLGGQLVTSTELDQLMNEIKGGRYRTWADIHEAYDRLWAGYSRRKQAHAMATLLTLLDVDDIKPEIWTHLLDDAVRIQEYIRDQVYVSRKKDYDNPFRQATFANAEEMKAVIGTPEDNSFVKQTNKDTEDFKELVRNIRGRV
ncbi:MAG: DUF4954 family protein [Phycisphaerales bacterium]|nr:DUF4954 family protein [Phycisphaerales bacterium]